MKRHFIPILFATLSACGGCDDDPDPIAIDLGSREDQGTVEDLGAADLGGVDASQPADMGMDAAPDFGVDAGVEMGSDSGDDMGTATPRVCEPDGLTPGTYDPDCVYLLGTLLPGSAGTDVFTLPGSDEIHYGFGNYSEYPVIHPVDGRLMFGDFSEWYFFVPDAVRGPGDPAPQYPSAPLDNDEVVDAPHCATLGTGTWRVWMFPDDGELAYGCFNDAGTLYLGGTSTSLEVSGEDLVALGPARRILTSPMQNAMELVQDGNVTAVTGLRDFERPIAGKWIDGRFVVAVFHQYAPVDIEMWSVEPNGSATSLGVVEQDAQYESYFQDCVMDPNALVYCFGTPTGTLSDVILAYSAGAPPVEVWTEAGSPVAAHISYLATGP